MIVTKIEQPTAFQGLNYSNVPPQIIKAAKKSKAFNKFSRYYNANVSYISVIDYAQKDTYHPTLIISEIRPKGIVRRIIDRLKGINNKKGAFFYISTNGHSDEALSRKLSEAHKNYMFGKYYDSIRCANYQHGM